MTLIPARFPTNFEGEIQCSIDWETQGDEDKAEMKSLHTNTHMSDSQEFLFLRLKKRSKFVSDIYYSLLTHISFFILCCRRRSPTQLNRGRMKLCTKM